LPSVKFDLLLGQSVMNDLVDGAGLGFYCGDYLIEVITRLEELIESIVLACLTETAIS
jgi:hypothetical protein